jgi:hypothetical protein
VDASIVARALGGRPSRLTAPNRHVWALSKGGGGATLFLTVSLPSSKELVVAMPMGRERGNAARQWLA